MAGCNIQPEPLQPQDQGRAGLVNTAMACAMATQQRSVGRKQAAAEGHAVSRQVAPCTWVHSDEPRAEVVLLLRADPTDKSAGRAAAANALVLATKAASAMVRLGQGS